MAKVRRLPGRVIRSRARRLDQDLLGDMVGGHGRSFLLDRAKRPASPLAPCSSQIGSQARCPTRPRICPLRALGTFRGASEAVSEHLSCPARDYSIIGKTVAPNAFISTLCSELIDLAPTRRHVSRPRCRTPMRRVPSQYSVYCTTVFCDCSRCSAAWRRTVRGCHILQRNRRRHVS
jgi:hypothetical protein